MSAQWRNKTAWVGGVSKSLRGERTYARTHTLISPTHTPCIRPCRNHSLIHASPRLRSWQHRYQHQTITHHHQDINTWLHHHDVMTDQELDLISGSLNIYKCLNVETGDLLWKWMCVCLHVLDLVTKWKCTLCKRMMFWDRNILSSL